jgi:dephospho-CoA kinase
MLTIGLTGGIGSGKSTVAKLFAELNIPIIDTDIIAREVVAPGQPALTEIAKTFGAEILTSDGQLNRLALRQIIFADATKRQQLEAILHPRIQTEMLRQATTLTAPYCIFVIPLLLEARQQHLVNRILVIDCDDAIRRQRLKHRDQMSDAEINRAFAAQVGREQRLAAADDIITNNGDIDQLRTQVQQLHSRYTLLAAQQRE